MFICSTCGETFEGGCDARCPDCYKEETWGDVIERVPELKDWLHQREEGRRRRAKARRERVKRERNEERHLPGPDAEEIMRLVKLQQFKDAADEPRHIEEQWAMFIDRTMGRAEVLLEHISRPPTRQWFEREMFLQSAIDAASWPRDEIPEPDEQEIEAMFAPKAKAEFHRRI
jgi:hypothetical protein